MFDSNKEFLKPAQTLFAAAIEKLKRSLCNTEKLLLKF